MYHAHSPQTSESFDAQSQLTAIIGQAEAGEWGGAQQQLRSLLDRDPERDDLHHLMGLLCLQLGELEAAIESYGAALRLQPATAHYQHDLGLALMQARRWQAASDAFRQAARLDPVTFDTKEAIADCQFELHCEQAQRRKQEWNLGAALQHARTAIVLRPHMALGHLLLGAIEYELGEYERSAQSHATAATLAADVVTLSRVLCWQSRSRLLDGLDSLAVTGPVPVGMTQREFSTLYAQLADIAQLPDVGLFQRRALAEPLIVGEAFAENAFHRALTGARDGNLLQARHALHQWLESPTEVSWTLLHDAQGRICFRGNSGVVADVQTKAGLLLEIALKCDHEPIRQCAAFVLLDQLRRADMHSQAHCLSQLVDPNMHYKLVHQGRTAASSSQRIPCVVFGTCITRGLVYLLNLCDEFRRCFALYPYITHMNQPLMIDFAVSDEIINSCKLLLHMPTVWEDWGNDGYYIQLLNRFDSQVPRITFPYPVFHALWPYHCHDKRNQDTSLKNAQGEQAYFPYGDSYVLGLMKKHPTESATQIAARYAAWDIPAHFDLDGLMRHSLAQQRLKEQVTDVKIIDHAQEYFRSQRLFLTVNHVGNASLLHMANQVLRLLELPMLPEKTALRLQELTTPQVPIHPSILKHYNITYLDSSSRYLVDTHRMLTFEEYTEQYVLFQ